MCWQRHGEKIQRSQNELGLSDLMFHAIFDDSSAIQS